MADQATIYDRIGGEAAIAAAVGMFYERIMADDSLQRFFANLDMEKQIDKQIAFMTMAFGGPHEYTGRDLRTAHRHLLEQGLDEKHFAAVAGHLKGTLEALSVPPELVKEVITLVGSTKADVLDQ